MAQGHLTAMVLDHSKTWTGAVQRVCKATGIELVHWSRAGEGWMPGFEMHKPHIVFIDLVLPKRDGLRCCRDILEANPATRIVLFHNFQSMAANHFDANATLMGVSAILPKPYNEKKLLKVVERVKGEVEAIQKAMGIIR